jgi:hypothetical protein
MTFIRQELAELTKQLQGREPSHKHTDFMNRLLKCAEQQGKQAQEQAVQTSQVLNHSLPAPCWL